MNTFTESENRLAKAIRNETREGTTYYAKTQDVDSATLAALAVALEDEAKNQGVKITVTIGEP